MGNKKNQRWLWYAWEPRFKRIVAHAFGKRNSQAFKRLKSLLAPFTVNFFCTDDFSVYKAHLPREKHIVGKRYTQRIERTTQLCSTRRLHCEYPKSGLFALIKTNKEKVVTQF